MLLLAVEKRKKQREFCRKWREDNREKQREYLRKWKIENPETWKSYMKKYYEKNPQAQTPEMAKYRRSHRECEWSYCEQTKSLHVHHILSQSKYPEYVDGDYHGQLGNNLICYCPFHHFAYHYVYSTKRNVKKRGNPVALLWARVERWVNDNKISIEDLEIELAQMFPSKVILA